MSNAMTEYNEDKQLLLNDELLSHKTEKYDSRERWPPKWATIASLEMFLLNFSIVAILQGATFTYLIGSLSTLEKRFAFESKVSGFILVAENVSQIIISPLVGYLGNKYNRPRIIAIGEVVAAISCFVFAIPYLIYGPSVQLLQSNVKSSFDLCKESSIGDECTSNTIWTAVIILWVASFLNGIGHTVYYTIGIPYIDDNTSKKNVPVYLSASAAVRMFGPAFGLLLSSKSLKYYESPAMEPNISQTDPRWIGCWWIGFIILGILLLISSIPLAFYSELKDNQKNSKRVHLTTVKHQLEDAFNAIKRLLKNPIFVFHVLGVTFKLIGILGYYIFKPKYIESQFRKSASDANFWAGSIIIPTMALGTLVSGLFLSKLKPNARSVAIYIFIIEIILSCGSLYAKTFQCPTPVFLQTEFSNKISLQTICSNECHCSTKVFQPVCSKNGIYNYFSPCHAGCSLEDTHIGSSEKKTFSGCKCEATGEVMNGYCPTECDQFKPYIILFAIISIITSTGKIGDTLITLRCVDPKDKNFAIGITGAFLAIFALIPYPILFGAITDSACKVWQQSCGANGNCWLYDIDKLNRYLHNSSFAFMITGCVLHFFVVIYSSRIPNMFEDTEEDQEVMLFDTDNNTTFIINEDRKES